MVKKVRQIVRLLEEDGWRLARSKGDHFIYTKEGAKRPIVVPGKMNDELKSGTEGSILREAGLKKKN